MEDAEQLRRGLIIISDAIVRMTEEGIDDRLIYASIITGARMIERLLGITKKARDETFKHADILIDEINASMMEEMSKI
jgi:copper(I)-binding protein